MDTKKIEVCEGWIVLTIPKTISAWALALGLTWITSLESFRKENIFFAAGVFSNILF